ncbi:MAG: ribonuclease III [Chloroflexi bacterium]|nr:ribonuclease III [Chloroflexota bacterium]
MPGELAALERGLDVSFGDKELLALALTHPSATNEAPEEFLESNQRLEFLGDALIDFVVAHELFLRLPEAPEGDLTELRSAIVRRESLARVARSISLGSYLRLGQGEERSGGQERDSNLSAGLEALIGAVLVDQGVQVACDMVLRLLGPEVERAVKDGVAKDPKSRLQELAQGMGKGSPRYRLVEEYGSEHRRTFIIEALVDGEAMGRGSGTRKVDAERAAALEVLRALEES